MWAVVVTHLYHSLKNDPLHSLVNAATSFCLRSKNCVLSLCTHAGSGYYNLANVILRKKRVISLILQLFETQRH